jgi:hypothetical protein
MPILKNHYVPILKWRQGEYQALSRLKEADKDLIVPLLIIPPIEYDFEEECLKKTIQAHIETFPNRFLSKWSKRKALVDIHDSLESEVMDNGSSVITYIFDELRKTGCIAIPVINLTRSGTFIQDVKKIAKVDEKGIALRIRLPELMAPDLNTRLEKTLTELSLDYQKIDLIIDLGKPESFEPYTDFSKALVNKIKKIDGLLAFRSFALVATSLNLSAIKKPGGEAIRHEWLLYRHVVNDLNDIRTPAYGDYSIETPDFTEMDMRQIRPSGKIVYTGDDVWLIPKGSAFRGSETQMIKHCKTIIDSAHWCGKDYSHGDKRINDTFLAIESHGNLSTWKQVGVSHHLVKAVEQLSKFHAP